MNKNYTFNNELQASFLYNSEDQELIRCYYHTLTIVSKFLHQLLPAANLFIESTRQKENPEFRIKANNKWITLTIIKDNLILKIDNQEYVLNISWNKNQSYVEVLSYKEIDGSNAIKQSIASHHVIIEIKRGDTILELNIPYDINYFLDIHYFNYLNESTSIAELKKVYMERFFPGQTDFEHSMYTEIAIKKIVGANIILLDELQIKEGYIEKYKLSSLKNGLLLRIEGNKKGENEIKIINYQSQEGIDLNKEVEALYTRSRKINFN